MSEPAVADPLEALAAQHGAIIAGSDPLAALAAQHGAERESPSTKSGLVMTATGEILPRTAKMATQFANSKTVPYVAAKIGRLIGGVAPIIAGAEHGGVTGALAGVAAASKGAWAGSKTGWFTGKLLQQVGRPIAATMDAAAPYAQTLSTLGGVQGGLDLAQMAEPDRKDIGFLGIGASMSRTPISRDVQDGMYAKAVTELMADGNSPTKAAAIIAQGDPAKFGQVMAAYMKSRMVK